jgi:dihydroneopterin aldolase
MDTITIKNLEVWYRVGVPDAEREQPQRLLLTIEMRCDFAAAAGADDLAQTIDYYAVAQRLLKLGDGRSWKLLETVAGQIADMVLVEFRPASVSVGIKKFIIPETRWVEVKVERQR